MKKYLKRIILAFVFTILFLCACNNNIQKNEKYVGKWIAVAGQISDMALSGDELENNYIELKKNGNVNIFFQGEKYKGKWQNNEKSLIIKVKKEEFICKTEKDYFVFEKALNTDYDITYAKEGTDAASPEKYIPQNAKEMLGKWHSVSMCDILGKKSSEEKSLSLDFSPYYTVDIFLDGEKYKTQKWYLSENYGGLKNSDYDITWEKTTEGIDVCVLINGEYYIFKCVK